MGLIGNTKGQALVELALSLLLLMFILFGITEFGRAMYITNTLNNAAREGARRAVVSNATPEGSLDTAALETQIKSCIPFDQTDLSITFDAAAPVSAGTPVTVTVTLPFQPVVPLLSSFFPTGFSLTGQASMRFE